MPTRRNPRPDVLPNLPDPVDPDVPDLPGPDQPQQPDLPEQLDEAPPLRERTAGAQIQSDGVRRYSPSG